MDEIRDRNLDEDDNIDSDDQGVDDLVTGSTGDVSDCESQLCGTCKAVFEGFDIARTPKHAASLWNSLGINKPKKRGREYETQLLKCHESILKRAAEGCLPCRAFLRLIDASGREEMERFDSLPARKDGRPTFAVIYKQSIDLMLFMSNHGTRPPPTLEISFRRDYGRQPYRERITGSMIVTPIEDSSNRPQTLEGNTGSSSTFELIDSWMLMCLGTHEECRKASETGFLPTYLVDVGTATPPTPRICLGEDVPKGWRYMTLSHCWGQSQLLTLTQTNLDSMMKGFDYNGLSKTFQDAIAVVQRLRQRYLWIDSLCIVQDSISVWLKESAVMGQIYSNSMCNICATASLNGSGGLFFERDPSDIQPVIAHVKNDGEPQLCSLYKPDFWESNIDLAPLNQRAWVCQERLLSPCNLHFAAEQVFWECRNMSACESAPSCIPGEFFMATMKQSLAGYLSLSEVIREDVPIWEAPGRFWMEVVSFYTRGALSFPGDKLVAVSGLAAQMQRISNGEYLAGLWRANLFNQLLWFRLETDDEFPEKLTEDYVVPSWSWASCQGAIGGQFSAPGDGEALIDIVDAQVQLKGQNPFGQVVGGHLTVRGKLTKAAYRLTKEKVEPGWANCSLDPQVSDEWVPESKKRFTTKELIGPNWSLNREQVMSNGGVVHLLPSMKNRVHLPGQNKETEPGFEEISGLILVETGEKSGEFLRCGTFQTVAVMNNLRIEKLEAGYRYFDSRCAESNLEYSEDPERGLIYTVTII